MKKFLLMSLLTFNVCAVNEPLCKKYKLNQEQGFSPIKQELPSRFEDQDIAELLFGKYLDQDIEDTKELDHATPPLKTPSPNPDNK